MAIKKLNGIISKIIDLSPTVKQFNIKFEENFEFKAGQFVNLSFDFEDEVLKRPYSIASNPLSSNEIELCIKLVENGKVTPKLFNKKIGDNLNILGPLGLFTIEKVEKEKLVFIGTGTGIAPLRGMIKDLLIKNVKKEIVLIFGCRFENEILYKEEFENLEKENPNFKYIKVISKPSENWNGRIGHVQDNFDVISPLNSSIFICGLPKMFEGSKEKLLEMGIEDKNINHEVFR